MGGGGVLKSRNYLNNLLSLVGNLIVLDVLYIECLYLIMISGLRTMLIRVSNLPINEDNNITLETCKALGYCR